MTYSWDYNPGMDTHFLIGPWHAPDGRSARAFHQYAHILSASGGVYWACINTTELSTKFFDLEEAKAFVLASVALS